MDGRFFFSSALALTMLLLPPAPEAGAWATARGQSGTEAVARSPRIGNIEESGVVEGCGCYFQFPSESRKRDSNRFVFWSEDRREALMNIDGRDERLQLVSATDGPRKLKVGSRSSASYTTGDGRVTVRIDRVATRVCKPGEEGCEFTAYDATVTTYRGGRRRQVIKVSGGCGC